MSTPEKNEAGALLESSAEVEDVAPDQAATAEIPAAMDEAPTDGAASPPKEVNPTMQVDVAQVDLLDLPLPPPSAPKVGKGPPPLPPNSSPEVAAVPAATPSSPGPGVSARKLLEGEPPKGNPALRFVLGLGVASVICAGAWFGLKTLRKPQAAATRPVAAASAPPSAAESAEPAPMRTITIAPIEMTGPDLGASAASSAQAAPSARPKASANSSSHASPHGSSSAPGATSKPHSGDDFIKVEN